MAARNPRIEAVGRTFAYVLNDGAPRLLIYQTDVRAIQLAKAALYAGAKLLIERRGAGPPERITLAGAFGSHIDPIYAMALGLIPDCDLAKVVSAGNAAGTGARIALLEPRRARRDRGAWSGGSRRSRPRSSRTSRTQFVAAMAIPNKTDAFPNLSARVDLPAPKETSSEGGRRRRRPASAEFALSQRGGARLAVASRLQCVAR